MGRPKKILLGLTVLAIGFGLAWQYRKTVKDGPTASDDATVWLPARDSRVTASQPAAPVVLTGQIESPMPAASETAGATGILTGNPAGPPPSPNDHAAPDPFGDSSIPELSSTFAMPSARLSKATRPVADADSRGGSSQPARSGESGDAAAPPLVHTLADGDTLAGLAARYLGSADRAAELFEFNRDVLVSPELLPIGAQLRIPKGPPRVPPPLPEGGSTSSQNPAQSSEPTDSGAGGLQRLPPIGP